MLTLLHKKYGGIILNCPICKFENDDNDRICKNCGCDLPKKPVSPAPDKSTAPSITPVDMARNRLLDQERTNNKIFLALKIMLVASLLCFFIPFAKYEFDSILNEDIANGLNTLVGYDYFEPVEIEPQNITAFGLIFGEEFTASDGSIFEISKSLYITFALFFIIAAIIFCFVPLSMDLRMKVVASLSTCALAMVVYQSFQRTSGLTDIRMLAGFYIIFFLLLASAAVSAYLKFNS